MAESTSKETNSVQPTSKISTQVNNVQDIIDNMSLHSKVCQLFVVTPEELTGVKTATSAGDITKNALENFPVAGLIYFEQNILNESQFKEMINNSQSYSDIPLLIGADEEGGDVTRIAGTFDVAQLQPMFCYKDQGTSTAKSNAETIASYLKKYGVNTDFAPDADIWSNPDNTVIGTRAYSDDFSQAAELVGAAVSGFKNKNEICAIKHFPGHGDTEQDSHKELAHITKSISNVKSQEFQPFKSGIESGTDMVMVGHLIVDELGDNIPATLNKTIVTDWLRNELNFNGVIITDSMSMDAIIDNYGIESAVVNSINAGIDLILMPSDLSAAVRTIEDAVENGTLSEERINESVARILEMKENNNLL